MKENDRLSAFLILEHIILIVGTGLYLWGIRFLVAILMLISVPVLLAMLFMLILEIISS